MTASLSTALGSATTERRIDSGSDIAENVARTILVIDDSALIRRVVEIALGGPPG